jgi:MoaA/NifB/PqqE/SkfB family radical SAM enzyme
VSWRTPVLAGVAAGRPEVGPSSVHIDITNGCNAACVTCWDHSPLLNEARPAAWKRRRLPLVRFEAIVAELDALGSVRHVVLSGMGEPLTHPDVYAMMAAIKRRGWQLTLISNLVAADLDRLATAGVDHLLAGVQGATPTSYMAFHPGWTERHFFDMCAVLRRLGRSGTRVRHVQVINRDTAPEVVEMVRFGHLFRADRVNYKLASLRGGTEGCAITEDQRGWLLAEGIPAARALASSLGVRTNLELFERQVASGGRSTAPMAEIGCFMGYVFTRITVDEEVLFCCNTEVRVGALREATFADLWWGERWQALRAHVAGGRFFQGCDQCGKLEQNVQWAALVAQSAAAPEDQALIGVSA